MRIAVKGSCQLDMTCVQDRLAEMLLDSINQLKVRLPTGELTMDFKGSHHICITILSP
jgi:hypothetical protein